MHYLQAVSEKVYANRILSSPTVRTILGLAGSNLFGTVIAVVGTLVQARFVSPDELGYFRQFAIASGYLFFMHLGVWDSLQRRYPYYIGKGQRERAVAVAEVAQAWNVAVAAVGAALFFALSIWALAQGNWKASLGWIVQAVVIVGVIYGGYLGATYRSGHEFARVAKGAVLSSVVGAMILPLFLVWPYLAMALRAGFSSLASITYLHIHRPLKIRWRFSWREWFVLNKEGIPMFLAGYGSTVGWSLVTTTLVWRELGLVALGFLTISVAVQEAALKLPQALGAVYTPRIIEEFGRTGSLAACLRMCRKPLLWGAPAMLLLAAAGSIGLWFIVPALMPKYLGAIPSMCIMLLFLPLIVLEIPYVLLVAMGDTLAQNVVTFVGLGVFAVLALAATYAGLGLNGVIAASLLGRLVRLTMIYGYVNRARHQHAHATVTPEPAEMD